MSAIKIPIDKVRSEAGYEYFVFVDIEVENIKQILKIFMTVSDDILHQSLNASNPIPGIAFLLKSGETLEVPIYLIGDYINTLDKNKTKELVKFFDPFIKLGTWEDKDEIREYYNIAIESGLESSEDIMKSIMTQGNGHLNPVTVEFYINFKNSLKNR